MKNQTNTKQATKNRLEELAEKRNALLHALTVSQTVKIDFNATVEELCSTVAQIATYKTLNRLADGAKDIGQSGADICLKMLRQFPLDMVIYRTNNLQEIYSDAMDIYHTAYLEVWQILHRQTPLNLDDTVLTIVQKNGNEKNYTIFQTACKSIRDYIRSWSSRDDFKKLQYVIGFAENGEQVTTSHKPKDDLQGIEEEHYTAFFNKYGLTDKQATICHLLINGETPQSIASALNIPLRTAQDQIKKIKAKFATASAYAEYITAKNAEKIAKAKAEKHREDKVYLSIYEQAQKRTAAALTTWKNLFHKKAK